MFYFLLQAVTTPPAGHQVPGLLQRIVDFLDTPAPYSPFTEYGGLLLLLWLLALKRKEGKDFSAEAQKVLDQKFQKGEIDKATYEKYRQELSMRIKKD